MAKVEKNKPPFNCSSSSLRGWMKGNEKGQQLSTMSRNRQAMKMNRHDTTTEEKNREEERKHKNSQKDQTVTGSLDLCSEY